MRVSFFLKLSCFFLILMISHPLIAVDFEYPKKNVLRLAVIGLVHDHVNWILNRKQSDVKIVGIVETNLRSVNRYKKRYNIPDSLFFDSYESLLEKHNSFIEQNKNTKLKRPNNWGGIEIFINQINRFFNIISMRNLSNIFSIF